MKLGWIGTGIMGSSMAGHLQAAGHELYIYNRTKEKAADLLKNGGKWCDFPSEVAASSEIVFTMVGFPGDKDMGIALEEAETAGLSLPGLALVHQLYIAVKAQGHGRLGTHALMLALKKMNNSVN